MLSITQSDNGYYCFEWISTEKGPKVVNYKYIKDNAGYRVNNFEKAISKLQPKIKDISKSLSISVNINNIKISSFTIDNIKNVNKGIRWYEENILNQTYLKNFKILYYPINSDENSQILLVVSIDRVFKKEIELLATKFSYKLLYLSVDIFSAYITAQQFFKTPLDQGILIWKIDKNNFHYFTFYENNNLSSFISFRISKKSFKIYQEIGLDKTNDILKNFILTVLIKKKKSNEINNIFVYQSKNNFKYIKEYVNNEKLNINLLDMSPIFNDKVNNMYNFLPYVENGISLRGIDV